MSAWVVSKEHIDSLLAAGLARAHWDRLSWYVGEFPHWTQHELTHDNAGEVGRMLWNENVVSVQFRYRGEAVEELPGPIGLTEDAVHTYKFPVWSAYVPTPVETLKAIGCYEYQSCEHPGWPKSSAHAFCQALRHHMIDQLPGYDEAPWGFDARTIAQCKARRLAESAAG